MKKQKTQRDRVGGQRQVILRLCGGQQAERSAKSPVDHFGAGDQSGVVHVAGARDGEPGRLGGIVAEEERVRAGSGQHGWLLHEVAAVSHT